MPDVVDHEVSVRQYLLFVENPDQLIDTGQLDELKAAVSAATDPIDRLKALARLERAQQPSEATYKEAFIRAAKTWADANAVPPSAFLTMGVDRSVLQAAGLLPSSRKAGRKGEAGAASSTAKTTTTQQVKDATLARKGDFTLTDIANSVGGSPMTIRKAVGELVEDGSVERLGPDPSWSSQGRAPIVYRRLTSA